jgi:hypothetical protein
MLDTQRAARLNQQNEKLNAEFLAKVEQNPDILQYHVWGYVINRGGPYGIDTENTVFGYCETHDDGTPNMRGKCKVLVRVVGGFLWLNYPKWDVRIGKVHAQKMLDFHKQHNLSF